VAPADAWVKVGEQNIHFFIFLSSFLKSYCMVTYEAARSCRGTWLDGCKLTES
jgi:hypothetical protein